MSTPTTETKTDSSSATTETCLCKRDATGNRNVRPKMRRHILGKSDATWMYMAQWKIQHEKVFPTEQNWLERYSKLYQQVEVVCPTALDGLLAPEKIRESTKPSPSPTAKLPSVITAKNLRLVKDVAKEESLDEGKEVFACFNGLPFNNNNSSVVPPRYRMVIMSDTLPERALVLRGQHKVQNSCGVDCWMGDHILALFNGPDQPELQCIPGNGTITKPTQLFKATAFSTLEKMPGDDIQGVLVSNNMLLVSIAKKKLDTTMVWHLGTVWQQSDAKDGEPMLLYMDMYPMS